VLGFPDRVVKVPNGRRALWPYARPGNRSSLEEIAARTAMASSSDSVERMGGPAWSRKGVGARRGIVLEAVYRWGYSPAEAARALRLDKSAISRYLRRKSPVS
jgi:hypothetical protein